jgi:hypothetical protein
MKDVMDYLNDEFINPDSFQDARIIQQWKLTYG